MSSVFYIIETTEHFCIFCYVFLFIFRSCIYDYVQVLDGSLSTSDVLGTFCGNTAPPPVISSANAMRIRFRTDASVTHVGFSLTYSIGEEEFIYVEGFCLCIVIAKLIS